MFYRAHRLLQERLIALDNLLEAAAYIGLQRTRSFYDRRGDDAIETYGTDVRRIAWSDLSSNPWAHRSNNSIRRPSWWTWPSWNVISILCTASSASMMPRYALLSSRIAAQ